MPAQSGRLPPVYSQKANTKTALQSVINKAEESPSITIDGDGAFGDITTATDVTFTITSDRNSSLYLEAAGDDGAFLIKSIMGRAIGTGGPDQLNDTDGFFVPLMAGFDSTFVITAIAADEDVLKTMTLTLTVGADSDLPAGTIALSKTLNAA
jgi:hypothetical protein